MNNNREEKNKKTNNVSLVPYVFLFHWDIWFAHQENWIDEQLKFVKEVRWTCAQQVTKRIETNGVKENRRRIAWFHFSFDEQCSLCCLSLEFSFLFASTFSSISLMFVSGHDTIHFPFLQFWLAWDVNARERLGTQCSFIAVGGPPDFRLLLHCRSSSQQRVLFHLQDNVNRESAI